MEQNPFLFESPHKPDIHRLFAHLELAERLDDRRKTIDAIVAGFAEAAGAQQVSLEKMTDLSEVQKRFGRHATLVRVESPEKALELLEGAPLTVDPGPRFEEGIANAAAMDNTEWPAIAFGEARTGKRATFLIGFNDQNLESRSAADTGSVTRQNRQATRVIRGKISPVDVRFVLMRVPNVNASERLLESFLAERWDPKTRDPEAPQFLYLLADLEAAHKVSRRAAA